MRTFSRATFDEAMAAWDAGDFSDEWARYRHEAALRGMIYPPEGTRWDTWEDDAPSQRAMLIRAIRDTPGLMHAAIARSRSWGDAIAYILSRRDEWRAEMAERDRADLLRRADEPTMTEATSALKAVLDRMRDS